MPTVDLGSVVGPQGPQGATGPQGPQGVQGDPGPSQVTGDTSTTLNGVLVGNGSKVSSKPIDGDGGMASKAYVDGQHNQIEDDSVANATYTLGVNNGALYIRLNT